jgi:hypothetical protein
MSAAVGQALSDLAEDPALRVGVITGDDPAFCGNRSEGADGRTFGAPKWPPGPTRSARHDRIRRVAVRSVPHQRVYASASGEFVPCSRMPRADIRRAGITAPHLGVLGSPARTRRDRWAPVIPLGQAPSDRGRQRPPRPRCLVPCHPVSPVALPSGAEPYFYYTFYYSARHAKGPLPSGKGP